MPGWRWLVVTAVVGLSVAYGFAFTLPGLVGEYVAALALVALIIEGVLGITRRLSARRHP